MPDTASPGYWLTVWRRLKKDRVAMGACGVILLLLAMALTSWNGAIRALGARRWQALHRSVYAVAVLAVLHFYWMRMGKNHFGEVWFYGLVLATLLGWRTWRWLRQRRLR